MESVPLFQMEKSYVEEQTDQGEDIEISISIELAMDNPINYMNNPNYIRYD